MEIAPFIFLISVIVFLAVILRLRKIATGKSLASMDTRPRLSDDEWAHQAQAMHYARKGTHEVTLEDLHGR